MRNIMKLLIILLTIFPLKLFACSCTEDVNLEFLAEKSEAVFIGVATSKNVFFSFSENEYKFKVKGLIKGSIGDEVKVITNSSANSCGLDYKKDQEYIIFAFKNKSNHLLKVDRCSSWLKSNLYMTNKFYEYYQNKNYVTPI